MLYSYNPILLILIINFLIAVFVTVLTVRRSDSLLNRYFTFYLMTLSIISGAYVLQFSAQVLSHKIFWANIKVIGICLMPLAWLFTTSLVTIRELPPKWLRRFVWLSVIVNIVVVYTDPWHHLFRQSVSTHQVFDTFYVMKSEFGLWYKTSYLYYLYLTVFVSIIYYIYGIFYSTPLKRIQYGFQIIAILIGAIGGVPYVWEYVPLDTFVFTIVFTSLIHYLLIFKFGYLDIVSIAKEVVVDKIDDGVLIYSNKGELVEANTKVSRFITHPMTFDELMSHFSIDKNELFNDGAIMRDIVVNDHNITLAIKGSTLNEFKKEISGYLVTLVDISEQQKLTQLMAEKEKVEQKKMMVNDIHDGISGGLSLINILSSQQFSSDSALREAMDQIKDIANDARQETRFIISSYNRDNPNFAELTGDLRYIGNLFTDGVGISFELEDNSYDFENTYVEFDLYLNLTRFFKECIVNIIKHSGATKIFSEINTDGRTIHMRIKDNGKGFDLSKLPVFKRDKLTFRIENMGGEILLDMKSGTSIEATVQLYKNDEE